LSRRFLSRTFATSTSCTQVYAWLTDVFTRLPHHRNSEACTQCESGEPLTSSELDYLLPDRWLIENPQHKWTIDTIRRQERTKKDV